MSAPLPDAVDVARRVADAFEAGGIEYAIGGAIAYGYWSEPRGTKDVDVNVFVDEREVQRVLAALRAAGCEFDEAGARERALERGDLVASCDGMRVDLFLLSIPYHEVARRTRVRVENLLGRPAWVLSAEATAYFKLFFHRGKDVVDLEHLVAARGRKLDHAHVRAAVVEVFGEDDVRTRTWDRIVATFGRGPPGA